MDYPKILGFFYFYTNIRLCNFFCRRHTIPEVVVKIALVAVNYVADAGYYKDVNKKIRTEYIRPD